MAPFLYGLYWKRTSPAACAACFLFGCGTMVLNMCAPQLFPAFLQSPINCGAFVMLAGFLIVPLVSLFGKVKDEAAGGESLLLL